MFISFFTGKVMLFYGISLIMKEKSNASALIWDVPRPHLLPATTASGPSDDRLCSQMRSSLGRRSPPSRESGFFRPEQAAEKSIDTIYKQ